MRGDRKQAENRPRMKRFDPHDIIPALAVLAGAALFCLPVLWTTLPMWAPD